MRICILGAGAYGSALGKILDENGHVVKFYDPIKFPGRSVEDAMIGAEGILLVAPSKEVKKLLPELPKDLPLISATKGILDPAVFADFPEFSVLSGATFAADLVDRQPSTLTTTSPLVRTLFENHWLKIEQTPDLKGVMLCGSLKNVYAIYSGTKGLVGGTTGFEDFINTVAFEMSAFLTANGADPATLNLSCGLPDVRLTCAGDRSRNYRFGQKLVSQDKITIEEILETTEGLSTVLSLNTYPNFHLPENAALAREVVELIAEKVIGLHHA